MKSKSGRWARFLWVLATSAGWIAVGADEFSAVDIGAPPGAGSTRQDAGGAIVVTGSGAGLGARGDQFHLAWQERRGDFDVQVRVESVVGPDLFTRAALTARATLEGDSPFAAAVATPSVAGLSFLWREYEGLTVGKQTGGLPANYPSVWLRLRRVGDVFTGATSYDGASWVQLGTVTIAMTNTVRLGMGVASLQGGELATATFRDFGESGGDILAAITPPMELPGPTSRRTGLVISEIMYHPPARADGRDLEFVEVFNSQSIFQDLSGCRLSGALDYTFPAGTVLPAGGFAVIARVPDDVRAVYGLANVLGGFTNRLDNGDGTIRLRNDIGAILQEVRFDSQPPWPVAADGAGHSLVLLRPSYGEGNPLAWAASRDKGGSPGRWDGVAADAFVPVVINEVLAHPAVGAADFVELYNHSAAAIDLSGAWLSDSAVTNKFRLPAGTVIPAAGYLSFDQTRLGFGLSSAGETVYFTAPDQSRVIDAVRFGSQAAGQSFGRFPDGAARRRGLTTPTPGRPNARPQPGDVVINEICYNPGGEGGGMEFVELHNRGSQPADLGGWRFTAGIGFTFAPGTSLAAGGYLVVASDAAGLRAAHPGLTAANCVGDYQGALANGGETLVLARPLELLATNLTGQITTHRVFAPVAEAAYADGGRWGEWSDGGGSSLELIDPAADPTLAANWADSDESGKGEWTTIEHTGVLDLGIGDNAYGPTQLQLFLEGGGECLVDDVEVIGPGGTNLVVNGDFENGLTGWTPQGSHSKSTLEVNAGIGGSQCLHVRAASRGDPGANRVRVNVARGLNEGDTATLRAKFRWVRGCPEVLLRLRGNQLEAFGRMRISAARGTPGAANSRRLDSAPPAIYEVSHAPVLPAADQAVLVTARVDAAGGAAALVLRYRPDPGTATSELPMVDDGTGGDAVPGDGLFSATIPGQPANSMVAFHVVATGAGDAPAGGTFPATAPARECLVRFGEAQPGGSFGTYRIWMTDATKRAWTTRLKLDNSDLDVTFVAGNTRVIYNAGAHYTGSPFVSTGFSGPTGALCGYVVAFPPDDGFLGAGDMKLDWPVRDGTLQLEQVAYWMAEQLRIPTSHRRFVNLFVNGVKRGSIYEDSQQPNSDLVAQYFSADTAGDLYKIDDWFEFDNGASGFANRDATLEDFPTTDGVKKLARYRWNWRKRAVQESANDYRSLFALVDATQAWDSPAVTRAIEAQMDVEEWMRVIALEHIVGNWDSFGFYRGKNMSAYKPQRGRWNLLMWDIDFVLSAQGYGPTGYLYDTIDPTIQTMVYYPPFRRVYLRALADAAAGPLRPASFGPLLAANYRAFQANSISASAPGAGSNFITARLKNIQSELNTLEQRFTVDATGGTLTAAGAVFDLQGTAPVKMKELRVNGVALPVTWLTETSWSLRIPLASGTNQIEIAGFDSQGRAIAGFSRQLTVRYPGAVDSPVGRVVFNEIMHHPAGPGAEYIELFNTSTTTLFDLSGWQVDGLGFVFPPGSVIEPGQFLVLAKDRVACVEAYGARVVPLAEFPGVLNPEGETLRLIKPGATRLADVLVAEVTYSSGAPWPAEANRGGVAVQLKDPTHGQDRPGNWEAYSPPTVSEWDLVSVTGTVTNRANTVLMYLSGLPPVQDLERLGGRWDGYISFGGSKSELGLEFRPLVPEGWEVYYFYTDQTGAEQIFPIGPATITNNTARFGWTAANPEFRMNLPTNGWTMTGRYYAQDNSSYPMYLTRSNPGGDVFVDNVFLVQGTTPETGPNLLRNGDFETGELAPWTLGTNHARSVIAEGIASGGAASLHLTAVVGGYHEASAVAQPIDGLTEGGIYTLSAQVRRGTNAAAVVLRLGDWSLTATKDLQPVKFQPQFFTPEARNSVAESLPPFPPLWINELQPVNLAGPADASGRREPWVELYNAGTNVIDLGECCLSDTFTNLARWRFPAPAAIQPGQFLLVWLDGEPGESHDPEWHADFRPAADTGALTLARLVSGQPRILDWVTYTNLPGGTSIGWAADGVPTRRIVLATPTPGGGNEGAPGLDVVINEWMVANDQFLADPADGDHDDWFELFNRRLVPADVSGCWLSDSSIAPRKSLLPPGTVIPAQGYLLVWADGEPGQNAPGREPHADFKLSAAGEMILLSTPEGRLLDSVSFAGGQRNQSEGRWPDGAAEPFRPFTFPTPRAANVWRSALRISEARWLPDGRLLLGWESTPGQRYRLQMTDDLTAASWTDAGPEIPSMGVTTSLPVTLPAAGARFFRLAFGAP